MSRADEIINLRDRELSAQGNIRSLWQEASKYLYPYVNITSTYSSGQRMTDDIFDMTPYLDMMDMVSGLKYVLIPGGQPFFAVKSENNSDNAQRYMSFITEQSHIKLFKSNFITEFDDVLCSLIVFGPASLYSEWTKNTGLNYRSNTIGTYQFIENAKRNVTGIILTARYTPLQSVEEFGEDKVGKSITEALKEPKKSNELFEFIYLCQPRKDINGSLSSKVSKNMPWESVIVNVKDKEITDEGGFEEFAYHCARWKRPADEKDGRGIGTEINPQIKVLQRMASDFQEVGNKWANPPREILDTFEGTPNVKPGANNFVTTMNSIRALEQGMMGNFPITEKSLERQTKLIDRAFFKNAFSPLEDLTGDRRTTLEIRERIKQSWPKIGPPITRIWSELLEPCIVRSILLLIRNGELPTPPPELSGANFGIEFVGPFALELKSQQAKAFQEWVGWIGQMEQAFPQSMERPSDYIDLKDAIPRMGRTFGVNTEDMASEEEVQAKQQARAEQQQKMEQMQAAQLASDAYAKGTKAPEEGSGTQKMMQGMGA